MNRKIKSIMIGMIGTIAMCTTVIGAVPYYLSQDNQVMVPARVVAETLGFQVMWGAENQQVILQNENVKMIFRINKDGYEKFVGSQLDECIVAYVPKQLGEEPVIIDGSTYIPSELFDYLLDEEDVVRIQDDMLLIKEGVAVKEY